MTSQFKTVGIVSRVRNHGVVETTKALIHFLSKLGQSIILDTDTAEALELEDPKLRAIPKEELSKESDLLIVIGGDGSLLNAAHTAVDNEVPVLGVNRGRLGFLTDIHPNGLAKIQSILEGDYIIEKRFLLTATVSSQKNVKGKTDALNEVALIPDTIPHMNEFEIYIDNQFLCSQDSDGVIIATPTGSTAYALSGGGPILHPQLDAMVIVPMFPHSLNMRPIVIEGNHRITISISPHNNATPRIICDGQAFMDAPPGSEITINKKPKQLHLIHPIDYDYYETLRSKLHWGHKLHYSV